MIRKISRPSTARCTLPMYLGFLWSEPNSPRCCRLADVRGISHASVNRFLPRAAYTPLDLFHEANSGLDLKGGTLSVDDSGLDKPYSQQRDLVRHCGSGHHHRVVKGITLIALYSTDGPGHHRPVNYRIYDKADGKTPNDSFPAMFAAGLAWGLEPALVTGDRWYSGGRNLQPISNHRLGVLFGLESNRLVAVATGAWVQVPPLELPEEGWEVWVRGVGSVQLFRTRLKEQPRHYAVPLPNGGQLASFGQEAFRRVHEQPWHIEQYPRAIQPVCHIEHFQVGGQVPIRNHIFC